MQYFEKEFSVFLAKPDLLVPPSVEKIRDAVHTGIKQLIDRLAYGPAGRSFNGFGVFCQHRLKVAGNGLRMIRDA